MGLLCAIGDARRVRSNVNIISLEGMPDRMVKDFMCERIRTRGLEETAL